MDSKVYIDISKTTTCCSLDLLLIVVSSIWSWFINCTRIFHKRNSRNIERIAGLIVIVGAVGSEGESAALIFPRLQLLLIAFLPETSIFSVKLLIFLERLPSPFSLILIRLLWLIFAFRRVGRSALALIFILGCLMGASLAILFERNARIVLLIGLLLLTTIPIQTIFGLV